MKCSIETSSSNPKLETVDNQVFVLTVMAYTKKEIKKLFIKIPML